MIWNYFKIARRTFSKNKLNTGINIIGLSISITCSIMLFVFARYESNFDSYHPHAEDTYRVVQHTKYVEETLLWNTTAYPLAAALRNDFPEIDIVSQTAGPTQRKLTFEDENGEIRIFEEDLILFADAYYPTMFDVKWLLGNPKTALQFPESIIITDHLVKKYFGIDQATDMQKVLGKTIYMNGKDPLKITGIVEKPRASTTLKYNVIIPYEFFKKHNTYFSSNWSGNYQGTTFITLLKNQDKGAIETKIKNWKKKYLKPEDDSRISYFLQPLSEIHTNPLYGSSPGSYVMPKNIIRVAIFVAFFILIIAIVNFVNLITAQSITRAKEVGIRKVIGGSRIQLIVQFALENAMLILITLVVAIGLSYMLLKELNSFLTVIHLQLKLTLDDIGIIVFTGVFTIILATIYPSVILSSFKPIEALKNKVIFKGFKNFGFRKALIIIQFLIIQLFVISSIIVALQIRYVNNYQLGFASEGVITTSIPSFDKIDVFRNKLLESNDIEKVTFGSGPPMAVNGLQLGTTFRLPEQRVEEGLEAEMKIGDTNYIDFYQLELLAGRNFTTTKNNFDEFIVNQKLIESKGWTPQEAIGKEISINEGTATIVGVVKDFHNNSLQYEITPCILLNWNSFQHLAFIQTNGSVYRSIDYLENTWKNTFPDAVYKYHFLDEAIEKEYIVEKLVFNGVILFSVLSVIIGALGLIGLMAFLTRSRTKEIGIRKVLGASRITCPLARLIIRPMSAGKPLDKGRVDHVGAAVT